MGHEVQITAFYGLEGGVLQWGCEHGTVPVFPRAYHPYGNDVMGAHAVQYRADVMISLIDAWVYEPAAFPPGLRWAPWFPIDHDPAPRAVLDKVSKAWARIVYSKFAEQQMKAAGLDCFYIPHGVDTEQFKPGDRAELRANLKLPADKFVVGMVAANKGNPSRKAFIENIMAFKALKAKHPDVLLYLHTVAGEENGGPNLLGFLDAQGLSYGFMGRDDPATKDVMFNDQYQALIGLSEVYMNAVYNSLDVLLLVTMGEGFGIPLIEAQAAGCPVITSDWTANAELCFSGWKVPRIKSTPFWTPMQSWQFIPNTAAITERLTAAYRMKDNQEYRDNARKGALAYDADKVAERYWKPALEQMQSEIDAWKPAEVASD